MAERSESQAPLTALQRALVDLVATRGPVSADQVRERLAATHPLTDSSVRTLLRRLESRGLVKHTVKGKVFLYSAEATSTRVTARTVRTLIDRVWAGSGDRFLTTLLDEHVLAPADLERALRKIRGHKLGDTSRATAAKK